MQGTDWGWSAPLTLGLLGGGIVILLLLIAFERRAAEPLIELGLFRKATFASGNFLIFAGQWSQISIAVFAVLYLQEVLRMSPLTAGLALLAGMAPTPFASIVAGRLADRFGQRWPGLAGLLLNAIALATFGVALTFKSYAVLVAPLLLWGASLPFIYVASRRAVMGAVAVEMRGQAGGINLTAQLFGGTVGIAISSMLLSLTHDYRVAFLMAAGVVFASFFIAWARFAHSQD